MGVIILIIIGKIKNKVTRHYMLETFVSVAVSALLSDSLLHLYPESLGVEQNPSDSKYSSENHLWKGLIMILTVYFFYFLEFFTIVVSKKFKNSNNKTSKTDINESHACNHKNTSHISIVVNNETANINNTNLSTKNKIINFFKINKTVYMLLVGDLFHNFIDGIVIGTQFMGLWPNGFKSGIMTSFAILCHEIPHEVGDFATMLSTGLSLKKALIINFFTNSICLIGGLMGCVLRNNLNTEWIQPIIAAIFIYISLVILMPKLVQNVCTPDKHWKYFICHTLGYMIGTIFLTLIAFNEDKFSVEHD